MKNLTLLIILIPLTIALTSCKKAAEKAAEKALEKAIEADSGEKVDIDLNAGGLTVKDSATGESMTMRTNETADGQQFTMTGPDGQTQFAIRETKEFPSDWPTIFPQYPGSEVEATQTMNMPEMSQQMVTLKTKDGIKAILDYYANAATKAGFTQEMRFTSEEGGQVGFVKGNNRFVAVASIEEDHTLIILQNIVMTEQENPDPDQDTLESTEIDEEALQSFRDAPPGLNSPGIPEMALAQGSLPEGFPVEAIPTYEEAQIQQAACSETEGMLMQSSTAPAEDILAFYEAHFASLGYKQTGSMVMQGITMLQYESEERSVAITVQPGEETNQVTIAWGKP